MSTHRTGTVYLDHAASTPMVDEAVDVMTDLLGRLGNPSSLHASGRRARRVVEESREQLAAAVGCRPADVVFTSGGTESDNLAVKGLAWARRAADPRRRRVLTGATEHHAVLDPAHWLAEAGEAEHVLLDVDRQGRLDLDALEAALEADPASAALVSVMWANNEVGTVQPLAEVVALAHRHGVPVHTDAVQALGALEVDLTTLGVDATTLSAHKVGGPYGVGALVCRREVGLVPLVHGGGQEQDLRSGTVDAPSIAAFATAAALAVERRAAHAARLAALRDDLVARVRAAVPDVVLNGPGAGGERLPGVAHLTFPGCEGDSLLMLLDARGIECSTGSACSAGVPQASHVLLAMGCDDAAARGSLRFSLGHDSTAADVAALGDEIGSVVDRARAAGRAAS
ncbi:cysteine desulfurase family protein [Nocardioides sp. CFH 31398]|uniref:cysteine desulfurase family protein n=1 Tax=Nocardioides sp. CFH 31398 TaxID=2919579 RepID=UPI001F0672F3|nr:cysteine desulfurase family protein [Nocardioides sp. CFH 31398]MCH1867253.1 cysteine desulfurase [Nocardioides sp. CFH 31398]